MANQEFNFSEMVCFSIYSTSNAMIREYRPELAKFQLTYPQFLVMMSLWNKDCVVIKDLSQQTMFDAATLTALLKKLEDKGFIVSAQSATDKRAKIIKLTQEGTALKQKTNHIFKEMSCKVKLSTEQQQQLIATCQDILNRLA